MGLADDFVQRQPCLFLGAQLFQRGVLKKGSQLIESDRFLGRVDDGFKFCFNAHS